MRDGGPGFGTALLLDPNIDRTFVVPMPKIADEPIISRVESITGQAQIRAFEEQIKNVNSLALSSRERQLACMDLGMTVLQSAYLIQRRPQIAETTIDLLLREILPARAEKEIDPNEIHKLSRDIACAFPLKQTELMAKINVSRIAHGLHTLEQERE